MKGILSSRYLIVALIFVISSLSEIIALGRQKAWIEPLERSGCEPIPPVPSILEAYNATSVWSFEWLISLGVPVILIALFLLSCKSWKGLVFWTPILIMHGFSRYFALAESKLHWGFCGLKRDGVLDALIMDVAVLCFTIICILVFFSARYIFTLFMQKSVNK